MSGVKCQLSVVQEHNVPIVKPYSFDVRRQVSSDWCRMQNVSTLQHDYSGEERGRKFMGIWHLAYKIIQGTSLKELRGFKDVFIGFKFVIVNSYTHT